MCSNSSIPQSPVTDHQASGDHPSMICPCPQCASPYLGWSEPIIVCPDCGSEWVLTPAQADDFALAVVGASNLPLAHFLAAINQAGGGSPPPAALAYPVGAPRVLRLAEPRGAGDWTAVLIGGAA